MNTKAPELPSIALDPIEGPPRDQLLRLSQVTPQTVPWLQPTTIPTLQRWTNPGVRGHMLRTVLVAGVKHTTSQWLWEFVIGMTTGASAEPTGRRTPSQRERARARAAAELDAAGI